MIAEPLSTDRSVAPARRPWRLLAGAVLVAACAGAGWWAWAGSARSVSLADLRVAAVTRGDLVRDALVQGRAIAAVSPTLYAPAAGTVALAVKAGDTVAAGQVLARIDSPELAAERAREHATLLQLQADSQRQEIVARQLRLAAERDADEAKLNLTAATRDLERIAEACAAGVVPQIDCLKRQDAVQAGRVRSTHATRHAELVTADSGFELQSLAQRVARQRAVVAELDRRIDTLAVRAPVASRVGSVAVAERAAVPANAPLMTVVDLSRLEVELQVPEIHAADLGLGMKVLLRIGSADVAGVVAAIAPEVQSGQVLVRARFVGTQPEGLRQNQRVAGRIVIDERHGVLTLARGPFVEALGGHAAYVIEGGDAVRRPVRLGALGVAAVEVAEGLAPGDRVVIAGTDPFDNAARVRLRP
ncbi:MAG: HlyD family efflux transporter periplasmic adaptor subunit [Rubrivivax sp.]|nr:HlyD family efflux transporter periplasmic adaptor subunit [Rubrivivax sp.]